MQDSTTPALVPPPSTPPPSGDTAPALTPPPGTGDQTVAVMLVFYETTGPVYLEDTAVLHPDGTVDINIPVGQTPPAGTGVQVTIYFPSGPVTYEGCTTIDPTTGTVGLDLGTTPMAL